MRLEVVIDSLDIMRPVAGASEDVLVRVLYLAPRETGFDGVKLQRIADCVMRLFEEPAYVRLQCTILKTSKCCPARVRARARNQPLYYSDVLRAISLASTQVLPLLLLAMTGWSGSNLIDMTRSSRTLSPMPSSLPAPSALPTATTNDGLDSLSVDHLLLSHALFERTGSATLPQKVRDNLLKGVGKRTTPKHAFALLFTAEHALAWLAAVIDAWAGEVGDMVQTGRKEGGRDCVQLVSSSPTNTSRRLRALTYGSAPQCIEFTYQIFNTIQLVKMHGQHSGT
ncbi:hypothetical protein D9615_010658 [Tricholomella constricta]|uniref:Uncharacterized protein n=1 Tax=Tricholomella constricta TaxID=117010 RepID=A0A8H5LRA1_9AGAR|nr:hypothetical protein D9615_010658 [Tricholomella constricta]